MKNEKIKTFWKAFCIHALKSAQHFSKISSYVINWGRKPPWTDVGARLPVSLSLSRKNRCGAVVKIYRMFRKDRFIMVLMTTHMPSSMSLLLLSPQAMSGRLHDQLRKIKKWTLRSLTKTDNVLTPIQTFQQGSWILLKKIDWSTKYSISIKSSYYSIVIFILS